MSLLRGCRSLITFSPAEILSFLIGYRQSTREAIENVETWMTRIKEQGAKGKAKDDV